MTGRDPASLGCCARYAHEATGVPVSSPSTACRPTTTAERAAFIEPSLAGLHAAMADGVPVLGYHHWTLMDNFEWIFGYEGKLGLHSRGPGDVRAHPQAQRRRLRRAGEGAAAWMSCRRVRFEHHREALGIGEASPRLSWQVAGEPGWRQAAYELAIGDEVFRVESASSVLVPWPDAPLRPREARTVRVRVTGADGCGVGLERPRDRGAGAGRASLGGRADLAWLSTSAVPRRCCAASSPSTADIAAARLYATAHGIYVAEINGRRVGDDALAPGWTSYHRRLRYQTYDVTGLVRPGANAIGFQVADGWWRGRLGFVPGARDTYGTLLGLLAQLEITRTDGSRVVIVTDATWRSATGRGPVRFADLYDGERYDATRELPGWSGPGFDDSGWAACRAGALDVATLVAPDGPPVRATEGRAVRETITTPSGRTVLDFGQNLVGRLRIRVRGRRGATVTIRHAEVLEDGELGTRPLRTARATDSYTLRGDPGGEDWEPEFTIHGFRYAEVSGDYDDLVRGRDGVPLRPRAHRLVRLLRRAAHPAAREHRVGHAGQLRRRADRLPAARRAARLDRATSRSSRPPRPTCTTARGSSPRGSGTCPRTRRRRGRCRCSCRGSTSPGRSLRLRRRPGWGDAAVIVPWVAYQRFGDVGLLRRQYASMRAWVDGLTAALGPGTLFDKPAMQLGDWLDPAAPPDEPWAAATDPHLVATAYRAHVADLLARIAAVLGEESDAVKYADLAEGVRQAFHDEYVTPRGRDRERLADRVRAGAGVRPAARP